MHRSLISLLTLLILRAMVAGAQSQSPVSPGAQPASSASPRVAAPPDKNLSAQDPEAANPQQPPPQPKTEILDSSATSGALVTDGHDPILDPPPLPKSITTLVGGIIGGVDRIRNHLTVDVFGGGRWTIFFDERTHIFRNGAEVTQLALKKGERIYVDTMLDNNKRDIFARNIRVGVTAPPADADGQITELDAGHHQLTLRDTINSTSVRFLVDNDTRISRGATPATFQDLRAGSLVRVKFAPERPNRGLAREIVILATPGAAFTFAGPITFLDTHRGILSVHNATDDKTYDITFIPDRANAASPLAVGAEVQVVATFQGTAYAAQQIKVTKLAGEAPKQ